MRINNNIAAVITNNQLLGNEDSLAKSMERLSSGLSINHASDNPSGIAIASRMQAQIEGLDQADNNANDGTSVIQTADGALKEVTEMLQRMRELSVQAANGTNSELERKSIQMEIDSLKEEVDRISQTTQFNTKNLLDGSMDARIYGEHCTRIQSNENVPAGKYTFKVKAAATQANLATKPHTVEEAWDSDERTETSYDVRMVNGEEQSTRTVVSTIAHITSPAYNTTDCKGLVDRINTTFYVNEVRKTVTNERLPDSDPNKTISEATSTSAQLKGFPIDGSMEINGVVAEFYQGMAGTEVYRVIKEAAETAGVLISDYDKPLELTSENYGANEFIRLGFYPQEIAEVLGGFEKMESSGTNPDLELQRETANSQFGKQALIYYEDRKVSIKDSNGFELSFMLDTGFEEGTDSNPVDADKGNVTLTVTDIGIMKLQIGSNMGQTMNIRIRDTSCNSMYIDEINVTKHNGAEEAMNLLDNAIQYISSVRSQLGAYENRLDHTSNSIGETGENMTSAISRIEDVDMATEMVEYTRLNVLAQAGTSALSQANELPNLALQLLQ